MALSTSFFDSTPIALVANAPWFILAALMYVVGFVGYYAGREYEFEKMGKPRWQPIPAKVDPMWAVPIGAVVIILLIAMQIGMGYWNEMDIYSGVILPLSYSIVIGSVAGLASFIVLRRSS